MSTFKLGSYIQFKNNPYIIVKSMGAGKVQILNPRLGNTSKRQVSLKNCIATKHRAIRVIHKSKDYLVTAKGFIISLTTAKVMKWGSENGDRKSIITEANRINKGV